MAGKQKKTILITGGAGFVGFSLAKRLANEEEYNVLVVDSLNDYYDVSLKKDRLAQLPGVTSYQKDISNKSALENVFVNNKVAIVVNLAAQAGVTYSKEHPDEYIKANIDGFFNVMDLSAKYNVERVLYASSSSVYGATKDMPFRETTACLSPMSLYAATKLADEAIASSYYYTHNLVSIGLRFFNVYGPWGRPDMAYFKWTRSLLSKEKIELRNRGEMWRDMTYVDDVVESIARLLEAKIDEPAILNVGNRTPVKIADLLECLSGELKTQANIVFTQKGDEEPIKTWADTNRLESLVHYTPETNYQEGIKNFVDWYKTYYGKD